MGVKTAIIKAASLLPGKYILFESAPDCTDNTKAVFDELVRRGLNETNRFVWVCNEEPEDFPRLKNVEYLRRGTPRCKHRMLRAKLLICCNRFIKPVNPRAVKVYLSHGTAVKRTLGYYRVPDDYRYILAPSEATVALAANQHELSPDRIFVMGYPRNDDLALPPLDLHRFFSVPYDKLIVWYPTFRQKKSGRTTGSSHALPILWDAEKAARLNGFAREKGVLVVLKPHPAQDVSFIGDLGLSNIVFIYDDFFKRNGLTAYRFLGSTDALLTDYSSVVFDYTLCDKPIGLIWEDYEEYERDPGFSIDMDHSMSCGEKIYDLEGLEKFIADVAAGEDPLREERRAIRDEFNCAADGKNAERVADFLIEKTGLFA